jgi:hypothetical protein|tara:strand:+ start:8398 stop:9837 length:1440 start_codon:yes stop_codon:yes gene_type:complete
MAIYKLFPEKDATLYTQNPAMNTGLDEILEASTYLLNDAAQTSRYLIKFSSNELTGAYTNYVSGSGISYLSTGSNALLTSITQNPTTLVNKVYSDIGLTSSLGTGVGGRADVTVTGNTITAITLTNRGKNYKIGDTLRISRLNRTNGQVATASITLNGGDFVTREYQTSLKNYAAVVTNLNSTSYLKVYPISQSWDMGTGRFGNSPITTNGCNWTGSTALKEWHQDGTAYTILTTASYNSIYGGTGGGTWYTGSTTLKNIVQTQTFTYSDPIDLNVDATNIADIWISHSLGITGADIPNEGFIVKQTSSFEFIPSESFASTFKYYSVDTNTIYPPQLEFKFDDFYYGTSSLMNTLGQSEAFISTYNNDGVYFSESVQRFRIAAVPQYPKKVFQTQSGYLTNYYLPKNSYYSIKDSETNEYVMDFNPKYTQVSADATSSYFDIYMGGLEPERYYTILLKTTINGTTKVFDEDIMFKVTNG